MERNKITLEDVERRLMENQRSAYYSWVRQVVTLSTGALTALVALRNNYVPANLQGLLLLKACWMGLALSILAGVAVLYGEPRTLLAAMNNLRKHRRYLGDRETAKMLEMNLSTKPKRFYTYAGKVLYVCFSSSMVLLCLFAVVSI